MEEFIGFIIFMVIAGISGLAKLQEKRKEDELRRQRANRKGVDELPEATRRMLYGDGGPPVARRRGEGPPPPVATPRAETPRPVPQRRPVPQQRPQGAPAAPQRHQAPQRQQSPSSPRPIAKPLAEPRTPRRPATEVNEAQIAAHERERLRSVADAAQQEARYRSTDAQKPEPVKKPTRRASQAQLFRELARNKNALRASMITMEVIGPPKALRD